MKKTIFATLLCLFALSVSLTATAFDPVENPLIEHVDSFDELTIDVVTIETAQINYAFDTNPENEVFNLAETIAPTVKCDLPIERLPEEKSYNINFTSSHFYFTFANCPDYPDINRNTNKCNLYESAGEIEAYIGERPAEPDLSDILMC